MGTTKAGTIGLLSFSARERNGFDKWAVARFAGLDQGTVELRSTGQPLRLRSGQAWGTVPT